MEVLIRGESWDHKQCGLQTVRKLVLNDSAHKAKTSITCGRDGIDYCIKTCAGAVPWRHCSAVWQRDIYVKPCGNVDRKLTETHAVDLSLPTWPPRWPALVLPHPLCLHP